MTLRRRAVLGLVLGSLLLFGCGDSDRASLADVSAGSARPDQLVHGLVIDVQPGPPLLLEIRDKGTAIWVSGFPKSVGRGGDVWTYVTGTPVDDPELGPVFPTKGPQAPPKGGISEGGALAIVIAVVALAGLLIPAVTSLWLRPRQTGRCKRCRTGLEAEWLSCPTCGQTTPRGEHAGPGPSLADWDAPGQLGGDPTGFPPPLTGMQAPVASAPPPAGPPPAYPSDDPWADPTAYLPGDG